MSILIKGMEMPTSQVLFCIHPDGKVFADLEGRWREYKAVPVPPHGDLIDRDVLKENCMKEDSFLAELLFRKVSNAPTIIPAEEGE